MDEIEATELVAALFDRCYTQLVRYAVRSVNEHDLAEDLVQDAFMQLYGALRSGRCIHYPKAWTMCVLRRAINRRVQERFDQEQIEDYEHIPNTGSRVGLLVPNRRLFVRSVAARGGSAATQAGGNEVQRDCGSAGNQHELRQHVPGASSPKAKKVAAQNTVKESVDLHEKKTIRRAS